MGAKLQEQKQDLIQCMNVIIESEVTPKFNLLADGQTQIREMLIYLRHRPEPLENSVFATVSASLIFPVSLAFSLAGREQGKFFILLRLLYPAVVQKNALSPLSREHRYSVLCRPLNGQAFPEHP